MSYPRILAKVLGEPWVITPASHKIIVDVLQRVQGFDAKEPRSNTDAPTHFNVESVGFTPPKDGSSRVFRAGKLAYIPVAGIIGKGLSGLETACGGYDINQLTRDVAEVMSEPRIKNVLFDFASPGGQVFGVPEAAAQIRSLSKEKNTYAYSGSEVASGAYWLYSQADQTYLAPSAVAGSVGVYCYLQDVSQAMEAQGVKPVLVRAGDHKGAGLPGVPLSEEQLGMMQAQVDQIYEMFTGDVLRNRSIRKSNLQGQIFMGQKAVDAGFADSLAKDFGKLLGGLV